MLLSQALLALNDQMFYEIKKDTEFDYLGLVESKAMGKICLFLESENYINKLPLNATAVITTANYSDSLLKKGLGVVVTDIPKILFFMLHNKLKSSMGYVRETFSTVIDETASISDFADIAPTNVKIGKNVIVEPFVKIYSNTIIGDDSIIRSGAKLGGCGFEFKRIDDTIMPVEHLGGVSIGTFCEIQNNSCIDRAVYPWDDTIIGNYTKIDNLVHIGHAAKIGNCVMIAANSGIGGRTEVEDNSWIGFGATIRNGIVVGKEARTNMGAVVTQNVAAREAVTGNFAIEHSLFIRELKNKQINTPVS